MMYSANIRSKRVVSHVLDYIWPQEYCQVTLCGKLYRQDESFYRAYTCNSIFFKI